MGADIGGVRRPLRPWASGQGATGTVSGLEDDRGGRGTFLEDVESDRALRREWAGRAFSGEEPVVDVRVLCPFC